jgi:hypothetical protein
MASPDKLGKNFKTISIECKNGHEVARYRKPKSEWGHRTHKLWLLLERINMLSTEPPLVVYDEKTKQDRLEIPELDTPIMCGNKDCKLYDKCQLEIGRIAMVGGTVALKLNENNLRPTKG